MKAREERELDRGRDFFERIIHDAGEFGEENVDEIDKEWAEFESFMRLVQGQLKHVWCLILNRQF